MVHSVMTRLLSTCTCAYEGKMNYQDVSFGGVIPYHLSMILKLFGDFNVFIDHVISARRPDLVIAISICVYCILLSHWTFTLLRRKWRRLICTKDLWVELEWLWKRELLVFISPFCCISQTFGWLNTILWISSYYTF